MHSPLGYLTLELDDSFLLGIGWNRLPGSSRRIRGGLAQQAAQELQDYFSDPTTGFSLPLKLEGSDFQQQVWTCLRKIPVGNTLTYGEIAKVLGTSPRAVGNACRANPCPIVVPCHRVVGRQGLGGFAGASSGRLLKVKAWLLTHEGALP
jgi:methylated-DNA-[protein]-cysteine S-methyltransferase